MAKKQFEEYKECEIEDFNMRREDFKIIQSMNYEEMIPMFIEAGLEMDADEQRPEGLLTCYELIDNNTKKRVGGASLAYISGEYVIKTVAIKKTYQGSGLGTELVNVIIQDAKENKSVIDATYGRKTRAVLVMDSGHIILSAVQPETIASRLDKEIEVQV